jgi:excisionase family DNA binding protein
MRDTVVLATDSVASMEQQADAVPTAQIEEFFTVEETAPKVKMSQQGLYAACREKQFPHVRIGKRIRIPSSALTRWVENQLKGGVAGE